MKSAYIHIPFCKQKCLYCDFNSFEHQEAMIESYMKALYKEIQREKIEQLYTTYIGGGTPSYIDEKYIAQILEMLPTSLETTIEMNPGTVTMSKLQAYVNAGVNRISMGLQVADDTILKMIGRIHTVKEFEEAYSMVRNVGFKNVNVDLMFGLPTQTINSFQENIEFLIHLKPEHISAYSLILHQPIFKNLPSEEEEREMYHYLVNRLKEAGYHHYEISNFCMPGYESKHNIAYWKQQEYYGFGAGASSFLNDKRYTNVKKIAQYISCVNENKEVRELDEILTEEKKLDEYMMLGLRLIKGISIRETDEKFHVDILKKYHTSLEKLKQYGLITIDEAIGLTSKGLDFANIVWQEFVS